MCVRLSICLCECNTNKSGGKKSFFSPEVSAGKQQLLLLLLQGKLENKCEIFPHSCPALTMCKSSQSLLQSCSEMKQVLWRGTSFISRSFFLYELLFSNLLEIIYKTFEHYIFWASILFFAVMLVCARKKCGNCWSHFFLCQLFSIVSRVLFLFQLHHYFILCLNLQNCIELNI